LTGFSPPASSFLDLSRPKVARAQKKKKKKKKSAQSPPAGDFQQRMLQLARIFIKCCRCHRVHKAGNEIILGAVIFFAVGLILDS
jgi:hypothetical protein